MEVVVPSAAIDAVLTLIVELLTFAAIGTAPHKEITGVFEQSNVVTSPDDVVLSPIDPSVLWPT